MFSPSLGKGGHGEHCMSLLAAHPPDIHLQAVKDKEEIAPSSGPPSATRVPTLSTSSANHGRWQPKEQLNLSTGGILINLGMDSTRSLVRSDQPKGSSSLGVQWPVELWPTEGPEGSQRHWGVFEAPCASGAAHTYLPTGGAPSLHAVMLLDQCKPPTLVLGLPWSRNLSWGISKGPLLVAPLSSCSPKTGKGFEQHLCKLLILLTLGLKLSITARQQNE